MPQVAERRHPVGGGVGRYGAAMRRPPAAGAMSAGVVLVLTAAPDATLQLREHRAKCASAVEPMIRRGVIVKFTVDRLTFKREFALSTGGAQ